MKSLPTNPSEAVKRRNPTLYSMWKDAVAESEKPKERRIRQSQKPLMNKLEQECHKILLLWFGQSIVLPQSMRFKLANGLWYKPDFVVFIGGLDSQDRRPRAFEVKGPHAFRGGFENLKVAAATYKFIRWTLMWKENGEWKEQLVLP